MNKCIKSLRRQDILACVDLCDNNQKRIDILVDKILELQDILFELQQAYTELLIRYRNEKQCAPNPF